MRSAPAFARMPRCSPCDHSDDVLHTYRERGHRHYGESVTELQHALQCAAFAQQAGEAPAVVAACLLHDYGHLGHDHGETIADAGVDARHENIGASQLGGLFTDEIVDASRLHVIAKRYLCWKDRAYYDVLSEASRRSLRLQGGPMNADEARAFECATRTSKSRWPCAAMTTGARWTAWRPRIWKRSGPRAYEKFLARGDEMTKSECRMTRCANLYGEVGAGASSLAPVAPWSREASAVILASFPRPPPAPLPKGSLVSSLIPSWPPTP